MLIGNIIEMHPKIVHFVKPMTNELRADRTGTQAIQRCAALLRLITTYNRKGMRLVDLYRSTGLTRPTAHRLLQALVAEEFVRQDERSKRYFLGALSYEMGVAAAAPYTYDLRDTCYPHLRDVAENTRSEERRVGKE